jgi:hypothetical protein
MLLQAKLRYPPLDGRSVEDLISKAAQKRLQLTLVQMRKSQQTWPSGMWITSGSIKFNEIQQIHRRRSERLPSR